MNLVTLRSIADLCRATRPTQRLAAGALLTVAALSGCSQDPPPFDPHTLSAPQRQAALEPPVRPTPPLPTTLEAPPLAAPRGNNNQVEPQPQRLPTTGPVIYDQAVRRGLRELVQTAVMYNPEIRVAGYSPAIAETRVTEELGLFDPSVFVGAGFEDRNALTGGTVQPLGFLDQRIHWVDRSDIYSVRGGIRQILQTGARAELRYEHQRAYYRPARFVKDPVREFALVLELSQPLLQNFGAEVNTARIRVARNNQRISLLDLRAAVEEQVVRLEEAYWRLYQLEQTLRIQEALLDRTILTARILRDRREGGVDVSRLETSQAESAVQEREAEVLSTKRQLQDISDFIKRLVGDPDMPVGSQVTILPATPPLEEPVRFDYADLMNTALANRPELAQQQLRINTASIATRLGRNALLPELNATVQLRSNGDAISEPFRGQYFTTQVGLEFIVRLGNRVGRAQWSRTLLQRQQAIEQYRQLVDQIAFEVKQAERNVHISWLEIGARRRARYSAEDALLAVEQRRDADEALTPVFVQLILDRQAAVARAQQSEAAAVAGYNLAIADLERRKGTLLQYNNIVMEEDQVPFTRRVFEEPRDRNGQLRRPVQQPVETVVPDEEPMDVPPAPVDEPLDQ